MTNTSVEVVRGEYRDSVTLMATSQAVRELPDVTTAMLAMGTELNVALFGDLGFDVEDVGPNDLVVAIRAGSPDALTTAQAAARDLLSASANLEGSGLAVGAPPARTFATAARRDGLKIALISVPGRYAFVEAMDALEAGAHVMLFSDNVAIEQEVALKAEAARRGLLVMGPDCGTTILGGIGLGFANVVRPGPIGIIGASGTGIQQLCCLLDAQQVGISAALGVGGRDLTEKVAAASTLPALMALDGDPSTELIVVVSKPPAGAVAARVRDAASHCSTPVFLAFLGLDQPNLTEVARALVAQLGQQWTDLPSWSTVDQPVVRGRWLRGLFSGGSLCDEATAIIAKRLGPVYSNTPLRAEWLVSATRRHGGNVVIDFGDDELTRGRAHPMIDDTLRLSRLAEEARDPSVGVILLDVILGHGAAPDPSSRLAPAIAAACGRGGLAVVVSVCGTVGDPQGLERQARTLRGAGALVYLSNAEAARKALELLV